MADGATVSGCTVHLVDEGVDSGMILAQSEVPVHPEDTESDLQERIKKVEHVLYPEVLERLSVGCLLYTSPSPRDVEESRMPSSA